MKNTKKNKQNYYEMEKKTIAELAALLVIEILKENKMEIPKKLEMETNLTIKKNILKSITIKIIP